MVGAYFYPLIKQYSTIYLFFNKINLKRNHMIFNDFIQFNFVISAPFLTLKTCDKCSYYCLYLFK